MAVAAFTGIISIGDGIRTHAIETIEAQSDLTLIEVVPDTRDGTTQLITNAKVDAFRAMDGVKAAAPIIRDSYSTKKQTYIGVLSIREKDVDDIIQPEYIRGTGYRHGTNEIILGYETGEKLQRYEGVRVGDMIPVIIRDYDIIGMPKDKEVYVTVSGIMKERNDQFDRLLILDRDTASTFRDHMESYDSALVRVNDTGSINKVVEKIESMGFKAKGPFEQVLVINRFMDLILLIFLIFSGFALIVGVLMITTTMITSVLEKSREIGITMAIGASEADVVKMVLFECLMIGILGGIIGDILGYCFASAANIAGEQILISRLGPEFSGIFGGDIALFTMWTLLSGIVISVIFSLAAGIYPAYKAATMNPVESIQGIK